MATTRALFRRQRPRPDALDRPRRQLLLCGGGLRVEGWAVQKAIQACDVSFWQSPVFGCRDHGLHIAGAGTAEAARAADIDQRAFGAAGYDDRLAELDVEPARQILELVEHADVAER